MQHDFDLDNTWALRANSQRQCYYHLKNDNNVKFAEKMQHDFDLDNNEGYNVRLVKKKSKDLENFIKWT